MKARSIADVTTGTILASIDIAAAPERVFTALVESADVTKWWGSDDWYRTTKFEADLRVGGAWRAEGVGADGKPFFVEGEYLEIDRPRRLVHTWKAPWDGSHETKVTYTLEPIETGTKVVLRHEGFAGRPDSCRGHGEGWERVMEWLDRFLVADKPFFARLVPPRATFPMDMTAEERALMEQHAQYVRKLLAQGKGLVFGPVMDPKGAYGIGVLQVKDEETAKKLLAEDPVVRAERGFRWELLPMASVVV